MSYKQKETKKQSIILAPAQFQLEPLNPPLPAAKTLHYPLPVDRHVKPKVNSIHIEQSTPLIVFNDMGIGIEEMGWGGWRANNLPLDPYDEALINEDILKLEELEKRNDKI